MEIVKAVKDVGVLKRLMFVTAYIPRDVPNYWEIIARFGCLHSSDQLAFCMDMELTSELINMKREQDSCIWSTKMQVILANHEDFMSEKPKVLRS